MDSSLVIGTVPGTGPLRWRVAAVAAAVLLVAVAVQGWAPQLLSRTTTANAPLIDAIDPIEQARHPFTPVAGRPGSLEVEDAAYRAVLDGAGVHYRPAGADGGLDIAVSSVSRGAQVTALEQGPWAPTAVRNRATRPLAAGLVEQVSARNGEIEWDVVLDQPPAGRGDLVVGADLIGAAGPARRMTHDGRPAWRIELPDGEQVRLGETVVLDATGAELHRALPDIGDGQLRLVVPGDALEQAAYPVTVDPTVGLPKTIRSAPSERPEVAYDGTNHLVVWNELVEPPFWGRIRGALVGPDGNLIGSPFDISDPADPKLSRAPDVAWNGTRYLVAWNYRYSASDYDLHGRFVSASGVAGSTIPVNSSIRYASEPSIAAGGSQFLVTWSDDTAGGANTEGALNIWISRIADDGTKLDGTYGKNLLPTNTTRFSPDAAWNGSNWLVVFSEDYDGDESGNIYGHLVDANGTRVGPATIPVGVFTTGERNLSSVASDGRGWLVAFDHRPVGTSLVDVLARRVDAAGTPIGGHIPIADLSYDERNPSVAFNGVYLVTYKEGVQGRDDDVRGPHVDTDGTLLNDRGGVTIGGSAGNEDEPAVAPASGYQRWSVAYTLNDQSVVEQTFSK